MKVKNYIANRYNKVKTTACIISVLDTKKDEGFMRDFDAESYARRLLLEDRNVVTRSDLEWEVKQYIGWREGYVEYEFGQPKVYTHQIWCHQKLEIEYYVYGKKYYAQIDSGYDELEMTKGKQITIYYERACPHNVSLYADRCLPWWIEKRLFRELEVGNTEEKTL